MSSCPALCAPKDVTTDKKQILKKEEKETWHESGPRGVSIRLTGFLTTSQGWRACCPERPPCRLPVLLQPAGHLYPPRCKSVMKGETSMNTPRGSLKSCAFLGHGICTMSPTLHPAWHTPSESGWPSHSAPSLCNCKLELDGAAIYVFSPERSQPLTTVFFLFSMYAYVYVICLPFPGLDQQTILLCLWSGLRAVIRRLWAKVTSAGLLPACLIVITVDWS